MAELIIRGIEEAKFVIFAKSPTSGRSCPGEIHSVEPDIAYRNTPDASNHPKVVYRIRVVGQDLIGRHGYSPPVGVLLDEHISSGRIA